MHNFIHKHKVKDKRNEKKKYIMHCIAIPKCGFNCFMYNFLFFVLSYKKKKKRIDVLFSVSVSPFTVSNCSMFF